MLAYQFLLLEDAPNRMQWVVLSVGLAAALYLLLRPRRQPKDPLEPGPSLSLSQQRAVERDMSNLLVELSEMARQISAQLDTRAARLELLINEAEQKIKQLQAMGADDSALRKARSAAARAGHAFADGNQSVTAPGEPAPTALDDPSPAVDAPDPRYLEIYALADQGRSAQEIAAQLARPSGEVELILALRPRSS